MLLIPTLAGTPATARAQQPDVPPPPPVTDAPIPDLPPAGETPAPEAPPPVDPGPAEEEDVRGTGVTGVVTDADGMPLAGAVVTVRRGGNGRAVTAADGRYHLELRPGSYELRISHEAAGARRVRVVVRRGPPLALDVELKGAEELIEVFVIEAAAEKKTEAGVLQIRRKSAAVSDALSAQEMSRSADSSAGDAVKRVVSATVVDGRYVYIRGLGGRYSSTLLNGVTLPSPEPDQQAVPLDLFPASLLANLTVVKSYTADLPGTFGGGALLIETNSYPQDFELKLKLGFSGDTVGTFNQRRGYDGGSLDWLGFDDGGRSLPAGVPQTGPALMGQNGLDATAMEGIGEAFHNQWSTREMAAYPNLSLGASIGDTIDAGGGKFGYLATLSLGRKETAQTAAVAKVRIDGGDVVYNENLTTVNGTQAASIGGIVNAGWRPRAGHDLDFFSLYTHTGQARAQFAYGYDNFDALDFESNRLQFTTRGLWFSQLIGQHRLLTPLELRWQANLAVTSATEPDTRDVKYNLLDDGRARFKAQPGSGERYFADLTDLSLGGGARVNWTPAAATTLTAGGSVQRSTRDYSSRRFLFSFVGSDPAVLFQPPEELFSPENIGPSFRLAEKTLPADAYQAALLVTSGYLMVDDTHLDPVRINAGARYEVADQELTPGSPFAITDDVPTGVDRKDTDLLPAVNLVYAATSTMNLRAGYSYTLARPQFRELAPFLYFDFTRRRSVSGNPRLLTTRIHNADLRWEWFAGDRGLLAASLFYKQFVDPIEAVIVSVGAGDVSFANAERANAFGVELEARGSLGRFSPALADLAAGANLTLLRSQIDLGDDAGPQTSAQRPLQGQSPYVINVNLVYARKQSGIEASLLYNVSGRRLAEVGFDTLPDVYEEEFHRVDATFSKKLGRGMGIKLAGANLLDRPVRVTQGGLDLLTYRPGVTVYATLEWSH